MKTRTRFRIGTRVCRFDDPRHVGTVSAVFGTLTIRVRWDTGPYSDEHSDDLIEERNAYDE